MIKLTKNRKSGSVLIAFSLLLLSGCLIQIIDVNPVTWDTYESIVDQHRRLTFKAPAGFKNGYGESINTVIDLSINDEHEQEARVAWLGYEPGGDSSRLSKFILTIWFSRYENDSNVESV